MRSRGNTIAVLLGLFVTAGGCGGNSSGNNPPQVCCNEADDAGLLTTCICGPQGTQSAGGITLTIAVNGSSCTVSGDANFTGTVVSESVCNGGVGGAASTGGSTSVGGATTMPTVNWVASDVTDTEMGVSPSVAAGSNAGATWMVQVEQQYNSTNPSLNYQSGAIGNLGPLGGYTNGIAPSIAALSASGDIFELHGGGGTNPIWWFQGSRTGAQTMSWPSGDAYVPGYQPHVAAVWLGTGAAIVSVHMAAQSPGALDYRALTWVGPSPGSLTFNLQAVQYDAGPSQNPNVAIGPAAGQSARVIEVHQDSGTNLAYRTGTLTVGSVTTGDAIVTWNVSAPFPNGEQGQHPAVIIYKTAVVEVHENMNGGLSCKTGIIDSKGVTWDSSKQYEATGAAPAIAVDPTSGAGVEVHQSTAVPGQLIQRAFTVSN